MAAGSPPIPPGFRCSLSSCSGQWRWGWISGRSPGPGPSRSRLLDQTLPGDLPAAVVSAIRVGFGRLSRRHRTCLRRPPFSRTACPPRLLARATEVSPAELIEALDELEWHRWLVSEPRGYEFAARIVRQVVARDMLTPGQRRRVLERLGR